MKIFLDECIDCRLAAELVGHAVMTPRQISQASIKDGDLLALAAQEFDIFLTVDEHFGSRADLVRFAIPVIVLQARSNRLADLRLLVPALLHALESAPAGHVTTVRPRMDAA